MYREFFGFTSKPFINTPDPDLFYCSESHEKALEAITYGIEQRCGFLSLIADVGSGKTTLCRVLLNKTDQYQIKSYTEPLSNTV